MSYERESAETIALRALAWLVGNDALMPGFMAASGASVDELRARAGEPEFLGSVLDYILTDDAAVVDFCDTVGMRYDALMHVRQALPGGQVEHWT